MTASYTCDWCLRATSNPNDVAHRFCSCCGSDDPTLIKTCAHRVGQTLADLFAAGVRLVRREPWAPGNYLELRGLPNGALLSHGWVHSPLEWSAPGQPAAGSPQAVLLMLTPKGGWEAYDGPTVDNPPAGWAPPTITDLGDGAFLVDGRPPEERAP